MEILENTALSLGKKIRQKEISVREAVKASLDQIDRQEPKIHPVPVGRKPCFKLFQLHIFLIMDHQSLPSSGKALMDSAYDLV